MKNGAGKMGKGLSSKFQDFELRQNTVTENLKLRLIFCHQLAGFLLQDLR